LVMALGGRRVEIRLSSLSLSSLLTRPTNTLRTVSYSIGSEIDVFVGETGRLKVGGNDGLRPVSGLMREGELDL